MHPRIAELIEYVDAQTAALHEVYETVPAERRATRPAPDRWSPAEIIHHLAIVDRRVVSRLSSLIEEARALPPETETTSILPAGLSARAVDRTKRFVTSEMAEPRNTEPERVWDDLMATRQDLMKVVATGDGLSLGSVSAPHPALGVLTAYEWIAFVGAHAARHADQIRESVA
jgi:DinB superfamily